MKFILNLSFLVITLTLSCYSQNKIAVQLGESLKGPYSGRLIVYAQADTSKPFGQVQEEQPGFAINVKNWASGDLKIIDSFSFSYLKNLDSLNPGYYKFIAILDTNMRERGNSAPGNLYTRKEVVALLNHDPSRPVVLTLSDVFTGKKFKENDSIKEVVFKSQMLSKFRKEDIYFKAGVVLPSSYLKDANKTYPVVYIIPGWGGTHHNASNKGYQISYGIGQGEEKIYVFLNPETQTPFGLHAFVDSRVNGPWGTAFVEELMPFITSKFRVSKVTSQTFISGQSSGGYGALWLALHFPDRFGGCWVTSPDPVDFSNFTGVNIYEDLNYYTDKTGKERGINFVDGKNTSILRKVAEKEMLEGDGGQQQSFEAEFGLPDKFGRPIPLFDAKTGIIDKKIAQSWKPYDLALYVQQNWNKIKSYASGRINIYAGENDNYLLQNSVIAFREKIKKVNAAINIEIVKNADHFTTRNGELTKKIQAQMDLSILQNSR